MREYAEKVGKKHRCGPGHVLTALVVLAFALTFGIVVANTDFSSAEAQLPEYVDDQLVTYKYDISNHEASVVGGKDMAIKFDVVIPETITIGSETYAVTSIAKNAFEDYTINTLRIGDNVKTIGDDALLNCSEFRGLHIGKNVQSIGKNFQFSAWDMVVTVDPANQYFKSLDGAVYNGDMTILLGGSNPAVPSTVTVPASVVKIADDAFLYRYNVNGIVFEAGSQIKVIGNKAFVGCKYPFSITIPSTVTTIGNGVFADAGKTTVILEAGNVNFVMDGGMLFNADKTVLVLGANVASAVIPASVKEIRASAFSNCDTLASVSFESGSLLETIGDKAFYGCKRPMTVNIPKNVTVVGSSAFGSPVGLTWNLDPQNNCLVSYDGMLFDKNKTKIYIGKNAASVVIPDSVAEICGSAFEGCDSITSITLPYVVTVSERAFAGCTAIVTADLPVAITVGESAFDGCTGLKTLTAPNLVRVEDTAFHDSERLKNLSLPKAKYIGRYAFHLESRARTWTDISLPSVKILKHGAFFNNYGIRSFYAPELTYLDLYSLYKIYHIKNYSLPSVMVVGLEAFYPADAVVTMSMPNARFFGLQAFKDCKNMEVMSIPEVEHISKGMFYHSYKLKTFTAPKLKEVPDIAFLESGVTAISLPKVTSLGVGAFVSSKLETIDIPLAESISDEAFNNCTKLQQVLMPNVKTIGADAFRNDASILAITMRADAVIDATGFSGAKVSSLNVTNLRSDLSIGGNAFSWTAGSFFGGTISDTLIITPEPSDAGTYDMTTLAVEGKTVCFTSIPSGGVSNFAASPIAGTLYRYSVSSWLSLSPIVQKQAPITPIYNGTVQTGLLPGTGFTVTGNTATDAGNYTATLTLDLGYVWYDGTTVPKTVNWVIERFDITTAAVVADTSEKSYTGSQITPTVSSVKYPVIATEIDSTYYAITYVNNTVPGTATLKITPNNPNLYGMWVANFNIKGTEYDMSGVKWTESSFDYDGI